MKKPYCRINSIITIIILIFFISLPGFYLEVLAGIGPGSTREEIIAAYGQPSGKLTTGNEEILTYNGGIIQLNNGQVTYIDKNFDNQAAKGVKEKTFIQNQKAKGLVEYRGKWMTLKEKIKLQKKLLTQAKTIKVYAKGGRKIDLNQIIVEGKVTIVDFYADWCGPCRSISPKLEKIANNDPDVYLRKIDIVNWKTPVVKQYSIRSVPNIRVFNTRGIMIGQPTSDINMVKAYIRKASQ